MNPDPLSFAQVFEYAAAPHEWMLVAADMKEAADILYNSGDGGISAAVYIDHPHTLVKRPLCSRPCVLLYSLALENIIKALRIAQDPSLVSDKKLSTSLKSHSLTTLLLGCPSVSVTKKQREALEMLEEGMPYWSRYPVPLFEKNIQEDKIITSDIQKEIDVIYKRIRREVYKITKNGWVSPSGTLKQTLTSSEHDPKMKRQVKRSNSRHSLRPKPKE